jgi:hypothetical protein
VNKLEYNKVQNNMTRQVQMKIKDNTWSVDKSWHGLDQNNRPKLPVNNTTTHIIRLVKRRKIQQHMTSNELLSRKITEIYMISTKMESPTHRSAAVLTNAHWVRLQSSHCKQ